MNKTATIQDRVQSALQLHQRGQLAAAEVSYREILHDDADHAMAMQYLGVLCVQTGRARDAVALIGRAVALRAGVADWYCNLGEAHRISGDPRQAIIAYREAIRLKPDLAVAHNNIGIAYTDLGQLSAAVDSYRVALRLKPDYADAYANLGGALNSVDQVEAAISACEKAISLQPRHAAAINTLGAAHASEGRWTQAVDAYRRALAIDPKYADALGNLSNALCVLDDGEGALDAAEKAVALRPKSYNLQWSRTVALLQSGDMRRGWPAHEWRWHNNPRSPMLRFKKAQWDGSPIEGKTILLHAEQGFGDTLHFVRYAPLVAERGARVILECQTEFAELFQSLAGVEKIIERGQTLPAFDEQCSLMSLPLAFGTELDSVPARVPYLSAPADRIEQFAPQRSGSRPLRIGLSWQGDPKHSNDRNRSIRLAMLEPLMRLAGPVEFHAVQKGPALEQAQQPPFDRFIIERTEPWHSFTDTAARMASLDLIITVDTALAHLAGALGRPVWTLIAKPFDWRWLSRTDKSPWYPTMRLFRQKDPGDWAEVVTRVEAALAELADRS